MSFVLSELVLESVIRDGFTALRRDPTLLADIFADFNQPYLASKYGARELNKLVDFFTNREVAIVHSFNLVPASSPCISIQLQDNPEDESKAHLDDFEEDLQTEITDPVALAALVVTRSMTGLSYDPKSGIVTCPDPVDLGSVRAGLLFTDASGTEFPIRTGISNTPGAKQFILSKNLSPDLTGPGLIKSPIDYTQAEIRGVVEKERLIVGVHTREALMTKYLYVVLKYILNSRKKDLILRGLQLPTYSGSDFTRSLNYPGDTVFDRFLTVTGTVQNAWNSDRVIPIDYVDVQVQVDRVQATNAQAGLTNSTVQIDDTIVPEDE